MRATLHARVVSAAAMAVVGLVVLLAGPDAWAHSQLVSSSPADGASVDTAPALVVLTFDQTVQDLGDAVVVTGPDGARVDQDAPAIAAATVTERLRPLVYRGRYVVTYRIVSADGHPVNQTLTFTLSTGREPPAVAATRAISAPRATSSGVGTGIVALVALLAVAGGGVAWRVGRRGR